MRHGLADTLGREIRHVDTHDDDVLRGGTDRIQRGLKQQFDPAGVFGQGRLYRGW